SVVRRNRRRRRRRGDRAMALGSEVPLDRGLDRTLLEVAPELGSPALVRGGNGAVPVPLGRHAQHRVADTLAAQLSIDTVLSCNSSEAVEVSEGVLLQGLADACLEHCDGERLITLEPVGLPQLMLEQTALLGLLDPHGGLGLARLRVLVDLLV